MTFTIQDYKKGFVPLSTLIEFLRTLDQDMTLSISSRIMIEEYVQKILNNGIMLVAVHGDSLLGVCGFYCNDHKSNVAFLTIIGVSPSCRGKGLASSLLKEAMEYSQAHGMQKMRLELSPDNVKALSLYRKHGFSMYAQQAGVNGQSDSIFLECKFADTS